MPGERDEIVTEHTQVFRVDRGSLEEVLTIARDMEEHAESMAKSAAAYADHIAKTFGVIVEKGDEVAEKVGKVAGKTEEAKSMMSELGGAATEVLTVLGISLPALSIAGLVGLGVAIHGQTVATQQWAHEVALVSNLSQEWLVSHESEMADIAREYGYTHDKVQDLGRAVAEAGFTGETAMSGFRLTLERVRETGLPVEAVAKGIAYELHELGYTEEEVAARTYQLAEWVDILTEAWKLNAYESRIAATGILELGMKLQDLTGMPALQMAEMLGIDWEEFTRLQMEEPEQLGVMIMEWVDEATKDAEAKYRPALIEEFLVRLFGIKDPVLARQMARMIVEDRIGPVEMPTYTKEQLAERRRIAGIEAKPEIDPFKMFKDILGPGGLPYWLSAMGERPIVLPEGEVQVGELFGPEYMMTTLAPLGQAIRRLWDRIRGVEPLAPDTGGGPGPFAVPFALGVPEAGPIEVNVNLIIEELPQGITVRTSDGMVLHTRGQGERFISPSP